jgi:predicted lipoprotein with Yx(FWY)xxD motif
MHRFPLIVVAILALLVVPVAAAPATPAGTPAAAGGLSIATSPDYGPYLATADGMALYTFALDVPGSGKTGCLNDCARKWPPYLAESIPALPEGVIGELSLVTLADGQTQLAYNGRPLYTYTGDFEPGQTNAHNLGTAWTECDCHSLGKSTPPPAPSLWSLVLLPAEGATPAS